MADPTATMPISPQLAQAFLSTTWLRRPTIRERLLTSAGLAAPLLATRAGHPRSIGSAATD